MLHEVESGDNFNVSKPPSKLIIAKINKWDYSILSHFCTAKETVPRI